MLFLRSVNIYLMDLSLYVNVPDSWLVLSFLRSISFLSIQERKSFTLLTSKDANWIVLWESCIAYR